MTNAGLEADKTFAKAPVNSRPTQHSDERLIASRAKMA
jgi:hypothetical protein